MPKPLTAIIAVAPKKPKRLEFAIPDGLDLEGKKPGDELEVVATLEVEEDGKLCLRKLNGIELPGYEDEGADDKGEPKNFAEATTEDTGY